MLGSFGLSRRGTLAMRAAPMGRALRHLGHDVRLVFVPWDCPQEAGRRFDLDGLPAYGLPGASTARLPVGGRAGLHAENTLRLAAWLVRYCRRWRPHVIHAVKPTAYGGVAALTLAGLRDLRLPAPRLVVDTDDWEGRGGWAAGASGAGAYRAPVWQRVFAVWQEPTVLRGADAVTVASRALETLTWSLGVPPQRVHYLPNALEASELARLGTAAAQREAGAGANDERPRLLLYSRLFEFAPDRLARVLARIRAARPDVRLTVLGEALGGEDRPLRAALAAVGALDMVDFVGWHGRDAALAVFARSALALVPFDDHLINRTRSSFKLIELMGAGIPVVAEAVGENATVIESGRSGLLAEPGDETALADAALAVLGDPALAARLGAGARERIAARFTWSRQAAALEAAYRVALTAR